MGDGAPTGCGQVETLIGEVAKYLTVGGPGVGTETKFAFLFGRDR